MKLLSTPKFHALGFQNSCQRALYLALQLFGGTNPSPKKILVPAIKGNPSAVPPVVAVSEVSAPAVIPDSKFVGSVKVIDMPTYIKVEAYLPYSASAVAKGKSLSPALIELCTPAALDLGDWLGTPASSTPGTEDLTGITTVESLLYRESLAALVELAAVSIPNLPTSSVEKGLYQPAAAVPPIPVVKVLLHLPKVEGMSYLGSVGASNGGGDV
jgi:hypothetical protein